MTNVFNSERTNNQVTRDNLGTLENYVERYLPSVIARLLHKVFVPLSPSPAYEERLINNIEEIIEDQQNAILEDVGEGSIFSNIIEINEELQQRL